MTTTASAPAAEKPDFDLTKLKDSYCVFGTNHLGAWNSDFQLFTDIGQPQYTDADKKVQTIVPSMVVYKSPTEMWVVSTDNSVYQWKQPSAPAPSNGWTKLEILAKDEKLRMLAFDHDKQLMGVTTDGKVVKWTSGDYASSWTEVNKTDWKVLMIAFDTSGAIWCVAEDSAPAATRVGQWNKDYKRWVSLGELEDRVVTMIAFDATSTLWCVWDSGSNPGTTTAPAPASATPAADAAKPTANAAKPTSSGAGAPAVGQDANTIAYWDATNETWIDPKLALPKIQWLTWKPGA
jgi:hypothetical protein